MKTPKYKVGDIVWWMNGARDIVCVAIQYVNYRLTNDVWKGPTYNLDGYGSGVEEDKLFTSLQDLQRCYQITG